MIEPFPRWEPVTAPIVIWKSLYLKLWVGAVRTSNIKIAPIKETPARHQTPAS